MGRKYEYINISIPKVRAKPGLSHDLQLMRDLEIANARTVAELGPLPPGGLPVVPKPKFIPSQSAATPAQAQANFDNQEEKAMKLSQMVTVAALVTGMASCEPTSEIEAAPSSSITPHESQPSPAATKVPSHKTLKENDSRGSSMNENESNELKSFIPHGAQSLAFANGDINSDGRQDVVLVIDYPGTGNEKLGEGLSRSLLLLVRDESGALQKMAENNKLIPCAQCGGIWGDPFSGVHVENGSFALVIEGGSRWHWFNEYTFRYDARRNDWFPLKIRKSVVDKLTTGGKDIELTGTRAPNVSFSDFDPDTLPSVEM